MTGVEESGPLEEQIVKARNESIEVKNSLVKAQSIFASGDNSKAREFLESNESPIIKAKASYGRLMNGVIKYCNHKRNQHNTAMSNEWFLKARLKHPIKSGALEKPDDLSDMPNNFYDMIPIENDSIKSKIDQLCEEDMTQCKGELNNSLGFNLVKREDNLKHINDKCLRFEVKNKANGFYSNALENYLKVMDANDRITTFYRAKLHAGKFTNEDYDKLLNEQKIPIDFINNGDNSLKSLDEYYVELHDQYYSYVSGQHRHSTSFTHYRAKRYRDSDGNSRTRQESYTTDGYKYYYNLTTVRPSGTKTDEIYVGEIDNHDLSMFEKNEWRYKRDEYVDWVVKWKKLHEDNTMIINGWKKDLNPTIEKE
jgi:hypothetical protein